MRNRRRLALLLTPGLCDVGDHTARLLTIDNGAQICTRCRLRWVVLPAITRHFH